MTASILLRRSLGFFWRTHLGVVLGTALATLVLTGALLVGDSVKATLRHQAEARVGRVTDAFVAGERFVRWAAKPEERSFVGGMIRPARDASGILLLQGTVLRPDQAARANRAQIVGVDDAFWKLSPSAQTISLSENQVALNTQLAAQLQVKVGDDILLRLEKPSALSKDAPLSGEETDIITFRSSIVRVLDDHDFGRFSLNSGQVPPPTAFLPLPLLQNRLGLAEKVNVVLQQGPLAAASGQPQQPDLLAKLADADLQIRELPSALGFELRTSRVFLDPPLVSATRQNESEPSGTGIHGVDALTYFVNELRAGDGTDANAKATPYSMVTAIDAPASGFVPAELADDEITITRWLADDLNADVGSKITLKYFVMGERRELIEKSRTFTVLGPILEMNEPQLNTSWMPDFPNVPDRGSFSSWKPGFPFEAHRIREKDEDYWDQYRGTPKAFVNLRAGQEMWSNRWGNLTSIRYPAATTREQLERVAKFIDPAALGFNLVPLREQALAATNAPVDFGQLFGGFSFFLILAAAVLTGLLFTFSIEQRAQEAGLLLAVGWPIKRVRRLFLREGLALALVGSIIGAALAAAYTLLVLHALSGVWGAATGGTQFVFAPTATALGIGVISGVLIALLAMWLASRRLFRLEAAVLLSGMSAVDDATSPKPAVPSQSTTTAPPSKTTRPSPLWEWTRRIIEVLAILGVVYVLSAQPKNPIIFFLTGFLLLAAGLSFSFRRLRRLATDRSDLPTMEGLALRNTSRRRGRSLATIGVLASGVFMVVAVDSFRKGPLDDPTRRESGTGGFTLIGESSSPIYEDLNSQRGREQYSLDDDIMAGVHVIQLRARAGDDASCLNLNRAIQPRVVGVKLSELTGRFGPPEKAQWQTPLATPANSSNKPVPALVDANTLQWSLQKKLGDLLEYQSDRGEKVNVSLAASFPASILQGMILIDEPAFTRHFPNTAGYGLFLIDCPPAKAAALREHLSRQLADRGLEIIPAAERLAQFNAVENTYLSIFQMLGGLGLLLGSAGLGIVVARNVLERRREFGLLEAVGFTPRQLRSLVFAEHRWLIIFALSIGAASAIIAVWPNLIQKGSAFPWVQSAALLVGMAILGAFWTWLATRTSLRGSLLSALRNE